MRVSCCAYSYRDYLKDGQMSLEAFLETCREIGFDALRKAAPPKEGETYAPGEIDLRLKPGSKAIDAGVSLPTVNDGFLGKSPDLGCYERGKALPHDGPRF